MHNAIERLGLNGRRDRHRSHCQLSHSTRHRARAVGHRHAVAARRTRRDRWQSQQRRAGPDHRRTVFRPSITQGRRARRHHAQHHVFTHHRSAAHRALLNRRSRHRQIERRVAAGRNGRGIRRNPDRGSALRGRAVAELAIIIIAHRPDATIGLQHHGVPLTQRDIADRSHDLNRSQLIGGRAYPELAKRVSPHAPEATVLLEEERRALSRHHPAHATAHHRPGHEGGGRRAVTQLPKRVRAIGPERAIRVHPQGKTSTHRRIDHVGCEFAGLVVGGSAQQEQVAIAGQENTATLPTEPVRPDGRDICPTGHQREWHDRTSPGIIFTQHPALGRAGAPERTVSPQEITLVVRHRDRPHVVENRLRHGIIQLIRSHTQRRAVIVAQTVGLSVRGQNQRMAGRRHQLDQRLRATARPEGQRRCGPIADRRQITEGAILR